ILRERRTIILPLAGVAVLNVAIYLLLVYPLSLRVSATEGRQTFAARQLAAAEREYAAARAMLTSKDRADAELRTFYGEVLPADLAGARRITYARLAQLAREADLSYDRRSYEPNASYDGSLQKVRITMVLEGEYRNVRRFIHALETAPEFVVIEEMSLTEGTDANAPLTLTLELATYFRAEGNGS
ncbi:MAG TPA: GspMb/PilO family protein, partial [Vicinamibacterales bacterium]|nr:GspMb/PilO family protein [Vicinamibacterales bacterium]